MSTFAETTAKVLFMNIYVNNKLAALKKGTSFEYVSENRLFSGSDGYTLTITFPPVSYTHLTLPTILRV